MSNPNSRDAERARRKEMFEERRKSWRPKLVLVGQEFRDGRPGGKFFKWCEGRVEVRLDAGSVVLDRKLGFTGEPITLTAPEIEAILAALAHSRQECQEWGAFWSSSSGYPGGMGAWYYTAPGKGSPDRRIGVSGLGFREGRSFKGEDERRPLAAPRFIAPGVEFVAELWRREPVVPEAGELKVGQEYRLPKGLKFTAWRMEECLERSGSRFWLEEYDDQLLRELLALMACETERKES